MNEDIYTFFKSRDADGLSDFMEKNSDTGRLKIQSSLAGGAIPLKDANIVIYKDFNDGRWIFYDGKTNSSGIADNIVLPAPPYKAPTPDDVEGPHATYMMSIEKDGFDPIVKPVDIYRGIKTLQPIVLNINGEV